MLTVRNYVIESTNKELTKERLDSRSDGVFVFTGDKDDLLLAGSDPKVAQVG